MHCRAIPDRRRPRREPLLAALAVLLAAACSNSTFIELGPVEETLTLSVNGGGAVALSPGGAVCNSQCTQQVARDSVLTLSAQPASGFVFSGWSGACSGSNPVCMVTVPGMALQISADFMRAAGNGGGSAGGSGGGSAGNGGGQGGGSGGGSAGGSGGGSGGGATYSISGTVSGALEAGTSILLVEGSATGSALFPSGPLLSSATSDASGNYQFTGLASGSYTLFAETAGLYFTPGTRAVTLTADATGEDFVASPDHCSADGWCEEYGAPQTNPLFGVWGASANDVWAVGYSGTLLHFDGAAWTWADSGSTSSQLQTIWGSGPADIWIAGYGSPTPYDHALLHYDGISWSDQSSALPTTAADLALSSLWGSGPDDVWLVGAVYPTIGADHLAATFHFDGTSWTEVANNSASALASVWGSGSGDVWAVGENGTILHWNGSAWAAFASGTTTYLGCVGGSGPNDVWAGNNANTGGLVLHWNGTAWSRSSAPSESYFNFSAVLAKSPSDVWLAGNSAFLHWDGTSWRVAAAPDWIYGMWGAAGASFAVGTSGSMYQLDSEESWERTSTGSGDFLYAVWGSSPEDLWAAGNLTVLHWDGAGWRIVELLSYPASAIWGSGSDDIWIAGESGSLQHWDGAAFTEISSATASNLKSLWGTESGEVWAVGDSGTIIHYGAPSGIAPIWATEVSNTAANLTGIWGTSATDVYAVGAGGVVRHWDGIGWSAIATGNSADASGIWGSGPDDIWIVYLDGSAVHWDGTSWDPAATGFIAPLNAVSGSGASDVWAAGNAIYHFDGQTWTQTAGNANGIAFALWSSAAGEAWLVGLDGVILHHAAATSAARGR